MKKTFTFLLSFSFFVLTPSSINSQTLEETLDNLSSSAGQAYLEPVSNAFGSNLNSGWYSGLPSPVRSKFTVKLKVVAIGTFFSDDDRDFTARGNFRFTEDQADEIVRNTSNLTPGSQQFEAAKDAILDKEDWEVGFSGPTIVGKEGEFLVVDFPGDASLGLDSYNLTVNEVEGFLDDLSILPQAAVQANIGTLLGTNVALRWFPEIDIEDLGKFKMFGIGFIHNFNTWFPNPLPVDIGVGFYTQTMDVGDIFESSSTQFGAYLSKTFGAAAVTFTPYLGLTTESADTKINYDYTFNAPGGISETAKIDFELEGENSFGTTVGFNLSLAVVDVIVDYKIAETNTLSGGIALGF